MPRQVTNLRRLRDVELESPYLSNALLPLSTSATLGTLAQPFTEVHGSNLNFTVTTDTPLSATTDQQATTVSLKYDPSKLTVVNDELTLVTQLSTVGSIASNDVEFPAPFHSTIDEQASTTTVHIALDPSLEVTNEGTLGVSTAYQNSTQQSIQDATAITYDPPLVTAPDPDSSKPPHLSISLGKGLEVDDDNKLRTNLGDAIECLGALSDGGLASIGLNEALSYGLTKLDDLYNEFPDESVTFLRLKASPDFNQKDSTLSISSQGAGRVPYWSALDQFNSRDSFTYNETNSTLSAPHVTLNSNFSPADAEAPTAAYVNQVYQAGDAINVSDLENGRRLVSVRTDASLALDSNKNLMVNLSPIVDNVTTRVVDGKLATGLTFQPGNGGLKIENRNQVKLAPTVSGAITFDGNNTFSDSLSVSHGLTRTDNDIALTLTSKNAQILLDLEAGEITGNIAVKDGSLLTLNENVLDTSITAGDHITITDGTISTDLKPYTAGEHVSITNNVIDVNIPDPEAYSGGPGISVEDHTIINTLSIEAGVGIIVVGSAETGGYIISAEGLKSKKKDSDDDEKTDNDDDLTMDTDMTNPETVEVTGAITSIIPLALTPLAALVGPIPAIIAAPAVFPLAGLLGALSIGGALFGTVFGYERERKKATNPDGTPQLDSDGNPIYVLDSSGNYIFTPVAATQLAITYDKDTRITRLNFDSPPEDIRVGYGTSAMNLSMSWMFETLISRPWTVALIQQAIAPLLDTADFHALFDPVSAIVSTLQTTVSNLPSLIFQGIANIKTSSGVTLAIDPNLSTVTIGLDLSVAATKANLDALVSRVSTNESSLTSLQNRATADEGAISTLQSGLVATNSAATSLTSRVVNVESAVSSLAASTYSTLKQDLLVSSGITLTPSDSASTLTLGYDSTIIAAKSTVDALATRTTTAESNITSLQGAATALTSRVSTNEGAIAALPTTIYTSLKGDLLTTSGIIISPSDSNKTLTVSYDSSVIASKSTVDALTTRTTAAEGNISSISSRVSTNEAAISSLPTTIYNGLKGDLLTTSGINLTASDSNRTLTVSYDSSVIASKSSVDALTTRVGSTEGNISALQSASTTTNNTVSALTTRVSTNESAIAALPTTIYTNLKADLQGSSGLIFTSSDSAKTVTASYDASVITSRAYALATYQPLLTAGTGLSLTGATLSLSPMQPSITQVGTLSSLTVSGATSLAGLTAGASALGALTGTTAAFSSTLRVTGATTLLASLTGTTATFTGTVSTGVIQANSDVQVSGVAQFANRVVQGGASVTDTTASANSSISYAYGWNGIGAPTLSASSTGVTYPNASTLSISGPPIAGTNLSITNAAALGIGSGPIIFSDTAVAAPIVGRSKGSRVILYPGSASADWSIGVGAGELWNSCPTSSGASAFTWYGNGQKVATLDGGGSFAITGPLSAPNLTAANGVDSGTTISAFNSSATANAYAYINVRNDNSQGGMFLNSSARSADGGTNSLTLRNDAGDLLLQGKSGSGLGIRIAATSQAVTSSGPVTAPAVFQTVPHFFWACATTNQSISTTSATTLQLYTNASYNRGVQTAPGWNNSTNQYTVQQNGLYKITTGFGIFGYTGANQVSVSLVQTTTSTNASTTQGQVFQAYTPGLSNNAIGQVTAVFVTYATTGQTFRMTVQGSVASSTAVLNPPGNVYMMGELMCAY